MPTWLLEWILPLAIQIMTPILVEGVKKLVELLKDKMPGSMVTSLAGIIGEVINQLQGHLTGVDLPPGMSGLIAVVLNELKNDFQDAAGHTPTSGF